jgi:concentrative nucleoside transporter, CNT family
MPTRLLSLAGILLILILAVAVSSHRRWIRLRVVGAAFALQAGVAVLVLYVPTGRDAIAWMAGGVAALLSYAGEGTAFLFGPFAASPLGANFALQALPVIIFFASLVSILYHLGVMQRIVRWLGGAIEAVVGISKVESLCAAANIFVGQSESPLVIRPYLAALRPSQLFQVMTSGMAGVAGTILAAYAAMGIRIEYLLAASFMSAPGAILMAKILMPDDPAELALPVTEMVDATGAAAEDERAANIIMAAAQGAQLGVKLAVMVGAMVFAFVGLVALANGILGGIGHWFGVADLSFQRLLGLVFAPAMYLIGVPWSQAGAAGGLFGEKIVLNEFVAYIHLSKIAGGLSPHTQAVVTFALCGFANVSSIAIQMAVTGGLAPNQRPLIAKLGLRALLAGSLANLMSAALAGLVIA